jgi:hypothetical protein
LRLSFANRDIPPAHELCDYRKWNPSWRPPELDYDRGPLNFGVIGYSIGPQTDVYMLGLALEQTTHAMMGAMHYSTKLRDLIHRMKEPTSRITVRDALNHEWFKSPPTDMMPCIIKSRQPPHQNIPSFVRRYSGAVMEGPIRQVDRDLFVDTFVRPQQQLLNDVLDQILCTTLEKIAADTKLKCSTQVTSGNLRPKLTYVVRTESAILGDAYVTYNGQNYEPHCKFVCVDGVLDFTTLTKTVSVWTTHGPFTLNDANFKTTLERAGLKLLATDPVFAVVDFKWNDDGDKVIDYREMLLLLKSFNFKSHQILEHFCFRVLDSNDD